MLFARIAGVLRPGGRFVPGDVVIPADAVTPVTTAPPRWPTSWARLADAGLDTATIWSSGGAAEWPG